MSKESSVFLLLSSRPSSIVKEYIGNNSFFAIPDSLDLLNNVSRLEEEDKKMITSFSLTSKWNGLPLVDLKMPVSIDLGSLPNNIINFINNSVLLQNNESLNTTNANDYIANVFFNLVKIEFFDGFEKDVNDFYDLQQPIFKILTKERFENLPTGSSLITVKVFIDFLSMFGFQGLQIKDNQIVNKIKIIKRT